MDRWFDAKRDIIEAFDGNLIREIPDVSFHLSQTAKDYRVQELMDYVEEQYDNYSLYEFINRNQSSFFENRVSRPSVGNDSKMIPAGSKLIKSFKHFVTGKTALEDIQNRASQIIQEDVINGTLCFSVHPLDYLSSSENTYNWRSCHALDGEYRAGNLSYMLDKSTIVCYLKGADNVKLPLFPEDVPWNSKKWRMLIFLNESWDMMFAGRQYPFETNVGMDIVRRELLYLLRKEEQICNWSDWIDPIIDEVKDSYGHGYDLRHNYIMMRGQLIDIEDVVINNSDLHFNDILRSSFYRPHYTAFNNRPWVKDKYKPVIIGGKCDCLRCNTNPITSPGTFMCVDCDLVYGKYDEEVFGICDCCGSRCYRDDMYYVDDEDICESCLNNECFYCDNCHEYHFDEYRVYVEETDSYICEQCAEAIKNDKGVY